MTKVKSRAGDWRVQLNGCDIHPSLVREADTLGGWVEVYDSFARYPGGRGIIFVDGNTISRQLFGDVTIRFRGIPLLRVSANRR